ncbi:MAG: oxidoreductase [Labilithrix sp.]|nr:oxidoreductase [Labilithrix sp.]
MSTSSLNRGSIAALFAFVALLPQCRSEDTSSAGKPLASASSGAYEYIVVGSGAGGGPLAARLARAGKRVLLLEAGDDVAKSLTYRVPAMHALATEDPSMAWWFWVQHSKDPAIDRQDWKRTAQGVLYPRGSALGGSTAVNAMVTVLPSRADWNRIAEITGDRSWRADAMDAYYDRVREWLGIELPEPAVALRDDTVANFLGAAARVDQPDGAGSAASLSTVLGHDVNEALRAGETTGLYRLPLATTNGERNGARERVVRTADEGHPLTIVTNAFVTRVLWDESAAVPTARGVEYVPQHAVYGASLAQEKVTAEPVQALASAEVIVSAGTFNSPQLLMLSGVGEDTQLAAHEIAARVALPGVGENLQDRYEAPVVSELARPLDVVAPCKLGDQAAAEADTDPCLASWRAGAADGVYRTPGFLASLLVRSRPEEPLADLQVFAVPTDARGYYPGYAKDSAAAKQRFTWLLLKAHTKNHDGTVKLSGASPFARPVIAFNSYDEKDPLHDPDLLALVAGVKLARRIATEMRALVPSDPVREVWPGPAVSSDDELAAWIRKESWGHHACCTNKMGRNDDPSAVVDSQFRVIGTRGLRVVDASVFPEIPGTFIALPTYMIAEKAADAILGAVR